MLVRLMLVLIKNVIKVTLDMYGKWIIIAAFATIGIITDIIVLWETFSGKSIVDVIWEFLAIETDKSQTNAQSSRSDRSEEK